ncbi:MULTISPECIES: membrane-bound PQQ-dependent dehydrogenase, glucose/quinate/shikimate family [Sphingobium]|uniref:Glucose dehydrogenase n=1 Tax=Sphingobium fuliginis (strain ATCC 27551) TaxID=336203 RepID=A0ABQ1ETI0_SPHSA|nr:MULTISPECIES: membrane-bound PQQ-dependent dehydrogenase, glucose/quinate/shikimate family [Sphingobium]RYL99633.1 membrane-bound PQQ-dependent dehydrogenase, glucose/quinate/shikimate family [Sphingobium fuliginis]WDA36533.1 membrane-bound PQQ-dependent dehydrogenase, glucose/quinate/shikimate family [Sphingobium sp. YC-XJ3]GFZ86128.1 glucose dehydrogenase [Sphingobium fuliginis]
MKSGRQTAKLLKVIAVLTGAVGTANLIGGIWLASLGGSPFYAAAGLTMLASAFLLWKRRAAALHLFAALVLATMAWAWAEIGVDWWPLVPRGDLIFLFGLLLILPWTVRRLAPAGGWVRNAGPLAVALAIAGIFGLAALMRDVHNLDGTLPGPRSTIAAEPNAMPDDDWQAYARSWRGDKFSPLTQLTPANVGKLEVAWQLRTGDLKRSGDPGETTYEMTPIKVDDTVYLCTPHNRVIAVDAETGRERWRFDPLIRTSARNMQHLTCRGLSYWDSSRAGASAADCPRRIFLATNDSRLIALDPRTGAPCRSFGRAGTVSLLPGQPHYNGGWYQVTSAPLVAHGLVVTGGAVYDNISTDVPSGVIRAYDALTGRLVWNFDPGNPDSTAPLGAGRHYTPSSPNSWSTPAADEALGLIYLPMGMGAVDQWGGRRPATTERFATSVLALDIVTGRPRWVFQTVHHDLWDMDVPAQPALVDLDLPGRGRVPALVQSTKTGNLFVLDRRNGKPLFPVEERPVPGGAAPGDRLSPTQPFSAISLMPAPARESDMWGATMLDQLYCRIRFKSLDYKGPFTPPSLRGTLVFPGNFGVMDWGGISIDPIRQVAFAHPNYVAFVDRLIPRAEMEDQGVRGPAGGSDRRGSDEQGYNPNAGAPFAVDMNPFLSFAGLPCQSPPWGYVAGIDLRSGRKVWEHKNGTIRDETFLPIPFKLGVPSLGGPMSTAGGLTFMAAAIDNYLRAYDTRTGKVLWRARLPAGGQATPMSYRSRASGRQFVIVVAGGHGSLGTKLGDHVIAYALPRQP